MAALLDRIDALARLGIANLLRVGFYRAGLRTGLHPVLKISDAVVPGPFFRGSPSPARAGLHRPVRWSEDFQAFSTHSIALQGAPDWNKSPFEPDITIPIDQRWDTISDFSTGVSDIKAVWEASRFDWAVSMAQRAALGEKSEADRLNTWLEDWQAACPPYLGPNWKCGQEASLRVLHLAAAALVLEEEQAPLPGLLALVKQHCRRIAPTMGYAKGQDNNHGTSEAAALYVAGSWLQRAGDADATAWLAAGKAGLEDRCARLIEEDGTFSQYSVTYHRLMLDTLSFVETWRRAFSLPDFSIRLRDRLKAATHWLYQFTDEATGDAPNLGANDGAMIMPLSDCDYRDFRPTVQWAAGLFCQARAYQSPGPYDRQPAWFGLPTPEPALASPRSQTFDRGGFHVLRSGQCTAYLRYPRLRFRPAQSDLLHCDLWANGQNLLRDGGTYSYAASESDAAFFAGVGAHNTAQFDDRDQMPRVGRFLFARWPKAFGVQRVATRDDEVSAGAGYRDWRGASHHRTLSLDGARLVCTDVLSGNAETATIRWRLLPGEWAVNSTSVVGDPMEITVKAITGAFQTRLDTSMESRFYLRKTPLPMVEITCSVPAEIVTEFTLR